MLKNLKVGETTKIEAMANSHQFTFAIDIDKSDSKEEQIRNEFQSELEKAAQKVAHKYNTKAKQVFKHG